MFKEQNYQLVSECLYVLRCHNKIVKDCSFQPLTCFRDELQVSFRNKVIWSGHTNVI